VDSVDRAKKRTAMKKSYVPLNDPAEAFLMYHFSCWHDEGGERKRKHG